MILFVVGVIVILCMVWFFIQKRKTENKQFSDNQYAEKIKEVEEDSFNFIEGEKDSNVLKNIIKTNCRVKEFINSIDKLEESEISGIECSDYIIKEVTKEIFNEGEIIEYIYEKLNLKINSEFINRNLFDIMSIFSLNRIKPAKNDAEAITLIENQLRYIIVILKIYDIKLIDVSKTLKEWQENYNEMEKDNKKYKNYLLTLLYMATLNLNRLYVGRYVDLGVRLSEIQVIVKIKELLQYQSLCLDNCKAEFGDINNDISEKIENLYNNYCIR